MHIFYHEVYSQSNGYCLHQQLTFFESQEKKKLFLDFLASAWYCITVREEKKAEFRSHLSAYRRLGLILHSTADTVCQRV